MQTNSFIKKLSVIKPHHTCEEIFTSRVHMVTNLASILGVIDSAVTFHIFENSEPSFCDMSFHKGLQITTL